MKYFKIGIVTIMITALIAGCYGCGKKETSKDDRGVYGDEGKIVIKQGDNYYVIPYVPPVDREEAKLMAQGQAIAEGLEVEGPDLPTDEELKNTPSDIAGMSQYDKQEMGLSYEDGSDTDCDGLTDKEEIEKYNSDPLKYSTMDDLYSDGYKVANGMDVNTYYEYKDDLEFANEGKEELKGIELVPTCATDFNAIVMCRHASMLWDELIKEKSEALPLAIYEFLTYRGTEFTIDMNELFDYYSETYDFDIKKEDLVVTCVKDEKNNIESFSVDDENIAQITLIEGFEDGRGYITLATGSDEIIDELAKRAEEYEEYIEEYTNQQNHGDSEAFEYLGNEGENKSSSTWDILTDKFDFLNKDAIEPQMDGFVAGIPIVAETGSSGVGLYCLETGSETYNKIEADVLKAAAKKIAGFSACKNIENNIVYLSYADLKKKKLAIYAWLPFKIDAEYLANAKENGNKFDLQKIYAWIPFKEAVQSINNLDLQEELIVNGGYGGLPIFEVPEGEFTLANTIGIENYSSTADDGQHFIEGHCKGISWLTALAYNSEKLPEDLIKGSSEVGLGKDNKGVDSDEKIHMEYDWSDNDQENQVHYNPLINNRLEDRFHFNLQLHKEYKYEVDGTRYKRKNVLDFKNIGTSKTNDFTYNMISMLECMQQESNDRGKSHIYYTDVCYMPYETIENLNTILDSGKIAILCMIECDAIGEKLNSHAINVVGYSHANDIAAENTFYKTTFYKAYDSNVPSKYIDGIGARYKYYRKDRFSVDNPYTEDIAASQGFFSVQKFPVIDKAGEIVDYTFLYDYEDGNGDEYDSINFMIDDEGNPRCVDKFEVFDENLESHSVQVRGNKDLSFWNSFYREGLKKDLEGKGDAFSVFNCNTDILEKGYYKKYGFEFHPMHGLTVKNNPLK